jgi:hypothetical protein
MKSLLLTGCFLVATLFSFAQKADFNGKIVNEKNEAMPFATVAFLLPEDSTLEYFGVSNGDGEFNVQSVAPGMYLMQVAFMGYNTLYREIEAGVTPPVLGVVKMEPKSLELGGVTITGERIPITIRNDTIEYNADAFKRKQDANVEDLLKKMPGMEIDRDGNVKAQGEDVVKILVDGKEFFGSDTKLATKNLPADAIKKVQVFEKQSDASEFTGIDDGQREKTINLLLKDGKTSGYFGDVKAGYGTDDTYEANATVNRFTKKTQASLLARMNNINDFGFSISDYLNFQGGMRSLMSRGSEIRSNSNNLPINTGQAQNGVLTSGGAGLNYNFEPRKGNRLNLSYLYNYSDKDLLQNSTTTFLTEKDDFLQTDSLIQESKNQGHRGSLYWKNDLDSLQRVVVRSSLDVTNATTEQQNFMQNLTLDNELLNSNDRNLLDESSGVIASGELMYLKKSAKKKGRLVQFDAGGAFDNSDNGTNWLNMLTLYNVPIDTNGLIFNDILLEEKQKRNSISEQKAFNGGVGYTEPIGKGNYLKLEVNGNFDETSFERNQFTATDVQDTKNENFSPALNRTLTYTEPSLSWNRTRDVSQLNVEFGTHLGNAETTFNLANNDSLRTQETFFLLPSVSWRKELGPSKNLRVRYNTSVNYPSVSQLNPVSDNSDVQNQLVGNMELNPEYAQSVSTSFYLYDQFSFTSLFTRINLQHTDEKIIYERSFNRGAQIAEAINYKDQLVASGDIYFGRPIRKLNLNTSLNYNRSMSWGYNLVNDAENKVNNVSDNISLTLSNRKGDIVTAEVGGNIGITNTKYSVDSDQNTEFLNYGAFIDIELNFNDKWNFSTSFDYTVYDNQSFGQKIEIPLLKAEITRYFMKMNRAALTLSAFDILDQYTGVERFSEQNYFGEQVSNIRGQYTMLTFKYKLNKLGAASQGGVDFNMGKRR